MVTPDEGVVLAGEGMIRIQCLSIDYPPMSDWMRSSKRWTFTIHELETCTGQQKNITQTPKIGIPTKITHSLDSLRLWITHTVVQSKGRGFDSMSNLLGCQNTKLPEVLQGFCVNRVTLQWRYWSRSPSWWWAFSAYQVGISLIQKSKKSCDYVIL